MLSILSHRSMLNNVNQVLFYFRIVRMSTEKKACVRNQQKEQSNLDYFLKLARGLRILARLRAHLLRQVAEVELHAYNAAAHLSVFPYPYELQWPRGHDLSPPDFERCVLGCVDAPLRDQILVGKYNSIFLSRPQF